MIEIIDQSSIVRQGSVRIEDNINNQRNFAHFDIPASSGVVPEVNTSVRIVRNDTVFEGKIISVMSRAEGANIIYQCECADHSFEFDRAIVLERFRNITAQEIIQFIRDKYAQSFTINNVNANVLIGSITFDRISPSQCLTRLANILNYYWYIDNDKDIHFFAKNTEQAPFELEDDNDTFIFDSLQIRSDISQIRNRVLVRGGEIEGDERTEIFDGDGEKDVFRLAYKYARRPVVKVDNVEKTVGIEFLDLEENFDCFWSFSEKYIRFKDGEIPPAGANIVEATGTPLYPIAVRVTNVDSVTQYGVYEIAKTDTRIRSRSEAREFARAELEKYAFSVNEGQFETYRPGLHSGQKIRINSASRGIDEEFIIQRVRFRSLTPDRGIWTVTVASVKTLSMVEFMQNLIRDTTFSETDQSTILTLIDTFDTLALVDEITDVSTSAPPYLYAPADPNDDESDANYARYNLSTWVTE